ncbi:hypothetical protein QTN47_16425 [Danxiaibacter flavus]|uniref:Right-handed parallel beta-helix repeat-containing protein n=1 Tax=Danxiaibacter flavus TaxID=3049108 RepID=A0ABV3ZGT0_9BACT|nr:hypothetical protein QNM32_16435 [Chitinophagaceae bacterium DXS]
MKKIYTFLPLLLMICSFSFAAVRTVCNIPTPSAQYSTIQAAIDASGNGDTIMVQGTSLTYTGFTLANKRVVIIGPGWWPQSQISAVPATVATSVINNAVASGSEIQGLTFVGLNITTASINNLRFIRNHFTGSITIGANTLTYSGYLFEGNWFEKSYIQANVASYFSNFIIQNNLFYAGGILYFTNSSNIVVDHNLFYYSGLYYPFGTNSYYACYNLVIQNNIFSKAAPVYGTSSTVKCTFKNNITFNTPATAPWTQNSNVDGGGNVLNQDPQMADQALVNSGTDNPLLNFTIAAGPANNKGNDGKDMGLLYNTTGSLNWNNSRTSRLPYIFTMKIANPTVASNGTLSVTLEARKNN